MGAGQQSTAQHGHNRGTAWAQDSKAQLSMDTTETQHGRRTAKHSTAWAQHSKGLNSAYTHHSWQYMSVTVTLQLVSYSDKQYYVATRVKHIAQVRLGARKTFVTQNQIQLICIEFCIYTSIQIAVYVVNSVIHVW